MTCARYIPPLAGACLTRRQLPLLIPTLTLPLRIVGVQEGSVTPSPNGQDANGSVPMYRGNAARTGEMPGPVPDYGTGIEERWRFSSGNDWLSPFAVANGTVLVGGEAGILYALDAKDGGELWHVAADGAVGAPAAVDGTVFFGSDDGTFYAISAEDGAEHWRFSTGNGWPSFPAVVDDIVFLGSDNGNLYALSVEDGSERWRFTSGDAGWLLPAVFDDSVFVSSIDNGILYAVNANDGSEQWRFTPGGSMSSPTVADGTVFVSANNNLYALDSRDGTERWHIAADGGVGAPAVVDGTAFVGMDWYLFALVAENGTERWRSTLPSGASVLAVVADSVFFSSDDGLLYALNGQDGSERWDIEIGADASSYLAVADSTVYIDNGSGTLYALGARRARLEPGAKARITTVTTLRGAPSSTAVDRGDLETDTIVFITGDSETTGNAVWWPVTVEATRAMGWVEESALEPIGYS